MTALQEMRQVSCGMDYFPSAMNPESVRRHARKALTGVDFDTVVGSGYSGVLPLGVIARSFGVNMCIVRKKLDFEHSHACSLVEGYLGRKWVFVDDFLSTGSTFVRVAETLESHIRRNHGSFKTELVGAFLYERTRPDDFLTPIEMGCRWPRIKDFLDGKRARS